MTEERSTLERVQEGVDDWKRYFETTTGAELEKESVIRAIVSIFILALVLNLNFHLFACSFFFQVFSTVV